MWVSLTGMSQKRLPCRAVCRAISAKARGGGGPAATGDAPDEVQETAEIDMKAVLEDDPGESGAASAPIAADERAADVLEETPEFLRETPEQDRLWFEQRPPRDFDFDR